MARMTREEHLGWAAQLPLDHPLRERMEALVSRRQKAEDLADGLDHGRGIVVNTDLRNIAPAGHPQAEVDAIDFELSQHRVAARVEVLAIMERRHRRKVLLSVMPVAVILAAVAAVLLSNL